MFHRHAQRQTDRDRQTERERENLDEDEAGVGAWITLTGFHVATDKSPLAVTATHTDSVPGGLTLIDTVASTATCWRRIH